MPSRRVHLHAPPHEVEEALARLREEAGVPLAPPDAVEAEAERAAAALALVLERAAAGDLAAADAVPSGVPRPRLVDAREVPFVTIDPPLSTDLDQAVHLARAGEGWRIDYAIASLAEVVAPGGPLDADVHERAVTVYGPGHSFPLHPPAISAGVCSLLPEVDRIALVWRITLDGEGAVDADLTRALVRSRAKLSYAEVQAAHDGTGALPDGVPSELPTLLREVGQARERRELERGGASLNIPEQEVVETEVGYRLTLRSTLPVENWNAQISLTTGIAAARMMAAAGVGVLRTLPPASERDVVRLRATAHAAGIAWGEEESYGQVLARLDAARPAEAAFLDEATTLFRGSGYRVLEGPLPAEARAPAAGSAPPAHEDDELDAWRYAAIASRYAHVTAPLRRLVDRYGLETCLALSAGTEVPGWVHDGLARVVEDMGAGTRRANRYGRGAVDAVEALLLRDRVGEVVTAVVTDVEDGKGDAQIAEPAARVRIRGEGLVAGTRIPARVAEVDVLTRTVVLEPAP